MMSSNRDSLNLSDIFESVGEEQPSMPWDSPIHSQENSALPLDTSFSDSESPSVGLVGPREPSGTLWPIPYNISIHAELSNSGLNFMTPENRLDQQARKMSSQDKSPVSRHHLSNRAPSEQPEGASTSLQAAPGGATKAGTSVQKPGVAKRPNVAPLDPEAKICGAAMSSINKMRALEDQAPRASPLLNERPAPDAVYAMVDVISTLAEVHGRFNQLFDENVAFSAQVVDSMSAVTNKNMIIKRLVDETTTKAGVLRTNVGGLRRDVSDSNRNLRDEAAQRRTGRQ